jgi:carbon monoxide dehydrogenase subunit G
VIHFEGTETFPLAIETVSAKLSDAGFLANCLADAVVTEASPDRAVWTVKPKLTFLSGELHTVCTASDKQPSAQVRFRLETKGIGSASVVEAKLDFAPDGTGTLVKWVGDMTSMTGLLKLAPKGLVEATAKKVIAEAWAEIHKKLAAT